MGRFSWRAALIFASLVAASRVPHAQTSPTGIRLGTAAITRMGTTPTSANPNLPDPAAFVAALLDVSNPAGMRWFSAWQDVTHGGTLTRYYSPYWNSKNLGQVFGITLGDPQTSDFFVTASGIYGYDPGSPGYFFAQDLGQKDLPGAVWRLNPLGGLAGPNGASDYELVANLPAKKTSLGQIAYNSKARILYVSNLADGRIYALVAPGNNATAYTTNQTSWVDVYPSSNAASVQTNDVDSIASNPLALGVPFSGAEALAAYGSRIWAVRYSPTEDRLYYSLINVDYRNALTNSSSASPKANEIWSIALTPAGTFVPGSARLELRLPYYPDSIGGIKPNVFSFGVSDISFSNDGQAMAVAERGELLGHVPHNQGPPWTGAHNSRVMTFALTNAGTGRQWLSTDPPDPPAPPPNAPPGLWGVFTGGSQNPPAEHHTNSGGGVDFADGYSLANAQTDVFLWSTINSWQTDAFVNNAAPTGAPMIYGAQGILLSDAKHRVLVALTTNSIQHDPPQLFMIDYGSNNLAKNQIGSIRVRRKESSPPVPCNCATVDSYEVRERILFAKVCTPTLNFSEIRVVEGDTILTPTSISPPLPLSGPPPYCVRVEVPLIGVGPQQIHFELASTANPETSLAQCCRSPVFGVTLPRGSGLPNELR